MPYFKIKLALQNKIPQAQLINQLKARGDDVIQISDGLCLKTKDGEKQLTSWFEEIGLDGAQISPVDTSTADLPKDVIAFINK